MSSLSALASFAVAGLSNEQISGDCDTFAENNQTKVCKKGQKAERY
jgi:hypothetical protein